MVLVCYKRGDVRMNIPALWCRTLVIIGFPHVICRYKFITHFSQWVTLLRHLPATNGTFDYACDGVCSGYAFVFTKPSMFHTRDLFHHCVSMNPFLCMSNNRIGDIGIITVTCAHFSLVICFSDDTVQCSRHVHLNICSTLFV